MVVKIFKIAGLFFAFLIIAGLSAYFTLSIMVKSEDTVIVPHFVGKDIIYVLEFMDELGLNTRVKGSEFSNVVPKNHIIFQDPEPGTEIKKGRDVKIIISKGTSTVLIPNLQGRSAQQARIIFEENDLCWGQISKIYHDSIEKDDVITQFPYPGSKVKKGRCVDLLISLGIRPKAYYMPDLTGLSLEEAILLIEENNLLYSETRLVYDEDKPINIIISQEPQAGHRVIEESLVNLAINRKVFNSDEDYPFENPERILNYRLTNGFLKRHIRVQMNSDGLSFDLFNEYIKPGNEIWVLVPGDTECTVILWEDDKLIKTLIYNAW